jgi:hypothetical protein
MKLYQVMHQEEVAAVVVPVLILLTPVLQVGMGELLSIIKGAILKTLFLLFLVLFSRSVFSQSSSRFTITRGVIAGGGTTFSSSARFQLGSTVAQPLAAVPSSARFSIQGGFWIRPAPIFFAPTAVNGNFVVSIQTELGGDYTVSYASSLTSPSWQTLTNLTGNGGIMTVTNFAPGVAQRFYRLIEQ